MDQTGIKLLNLMFRPGETICVTHNMFGYHSIPLENVIAGPKVTLVPTPESCEKRKIIWGPENFESVSTDQLTLVALNPIKGFRQDTNCTGFRNFLIEMDYGPLPQQLAYAKQIGLPYSACVFSGGKSLHFLISLDVDLPNEEVWREFAEWTLAIATLADQNTKNPSRSIRIPGAMREPGKKQLLVEQKGPTSLNDFLIWLRAHPEARPKKHEKRQISGEVNWYRLRKWTKDLLLNGLDPNKGRNKQWFSIACDFALAGYSEDDTLDLLYQFFQPDRDFKEREWKTAIKSAFKYIYENRDQE